MIQYSRRFVEKVLAGCVKEGTLRAAPGGYLFLFAVRVNDTIYTKGKGTPVID